MTYGKLKILFINIVAIIYKTTTLNVHHLHSDLREAKSVVNSVQEDLWIRELFLFLISSLLLVRFLLCFVGLASNIVAIYPILTSSQPELLMPTIIVQLFDNVVLNIYELLLGYTCFKYLYPESRAVFVVFAVKMIIKTTCCGFALNLYSDKHHQLSIQEDYRDSPGRESLEEIELSHQYFRRFTGTSQ